MNVCTEEKVRGKPSLSILALASFTASFVIARVFTTLNPYVTWKIGHYHIHHLWFGIALLAIGGWLGISYKSERVGRLAAILFGAGGGIIGDEAGLLLTMNNYWTGITYTLIIAFLTLASLLILLFRYSKVIVAELAGLARSRLSVYVSLFLALVSLAVMLQTSNIVVIVASGVLAIASCLVIILYFVHHFRNKT
jgi:hypothetical protein